MQITVTDRMEIGGTRRTADGYLVADARMARTGIYEYSGQEVGKPDMAKVRVYRSADEVFSQDAMASFAHKPVTNGHPNQNVDQSTWKRDAVGFTDGTVARDGDFVRIPLMVADQDAIDDVEAGKRELSAGYTCDIQFLDGETPEGEKYDAVMTGIRGNHVAIVGRGRAGSECRIGDRFTQEHDAMNLKTILVDGLQVQTTDAGEAAILKLQGDLKTRDTAAAQADQAHQTALAAKDTELAQKDATIADLQGKVLDAAALDKLVADRAALVSTVARLVPTFDAKGKTEAEIKRGVVQAKCGDAAVNDRSDAYVDARYDTLVEALDANGGGTDHLRDHLRGGGSAVTTPGGMSLADAKAAEEKALADATDLNGWRNKTAA